MWTNESIIDTNIHKAFVYIIKNLDTGELYIGKKQTFQRRYNHSTKRYKITESDWRTYQSSSAEVSKWTNVEKSILHPCTEIKEATYIETSLLFKYDVLDPNNLYRNKNIGGKYFKHYPYNS